MHLKALVYLRICLVGCLDESYVQSDIIEVRKAEKELGTKFYNSGRKWAIAPEVLMEATGSVEKKPNRYTRDCIITFIQGTWINAIGSEWVN